MGRMIRLEIPGEPRGKERPRFANGRTYTPQKTVDYENLIKTEYLRVFNPVAFPSGTPISMTVIVYFATPKSASKRAVQDMLSGASMPTKKPDVDNIAKVIMDGLNGLAYKDDSQIVDLEVVKRYASVAKVVVFIREKEVCLL